MPADEIGEAFIRVIFRYIVSFVVEILWDLVSFYIGLSVENWSPLVNNQEGIPPRLKK